MRVYEVLSQTKVSPPDEGLLEDLTGHDSMDDTALLLDGQYLAGIVKPGQRELGVWRISDGTEMTRCFIHSSAVCICTANDDRTLLIGCSDGRIIAMSLLAGLSDAVTEHITHLPSRSLDLDTTLAEITMHRLREKTPSTELSSSSTTEQIGSDIRQIDRSLPQLRALSAARRSQTKDKQRSSESFRRIHSAIGSSRTRSQACCIQ